MVHVALYIWMYIHLSLCFKKLNPTSKSFESLDVEKRSSVKLISSLVEILISFHNSYVEILDKNVNVSLYQQKEV